MPVATLVAASAPSRLAHLLFEDLHGRVGVAAVDVARFLAQGNLLPLIHILVAKGYAVDHRHLGGALQKVSSSPAHTARVPIRGSFAMTASWG